MSGRSCEKRWVELGEALHSGLYWLLKEVGELGVAPLARVVTRPAACAPGASKNDGATCIRTWVCLLPSQHVHRGLLPSQHMHMGLAVAKSAYANESAFYRVSILTGVNLLPGQHMHKSLSVAKSAYAHGSV